MSLVFDEYGRPFIILREQQEKARIKGIEAQKVSPTILLTNKMQITILSQRQIFLPLDLFPIY